MMKIKKSRFALTIISTILVTVLLIGGGLYLFMECSDLALVSNSEDH